MFTTEAVLTYASRAVHSWAAKYGRGGGLLCFVIHQLLKYVVSFASASPAFLIGKYSS